MKQPTSTRPLPAHSAVAIVTFIFIFIISVSVEGATSSEKSSTSEEALFYGGQLIANFSGGWKREGKSEKLSGFKYLLLIRSTPHDSWRRQITRKTWLHPLSASQVSHHKKSKQPVIPYFFLLEEPTNEANKKMLDDEAAQHHDLLIVQDIRFALTAGGQRDMGMKTQALFTWTTRHFSSLEILLMMDDDIFVNRWLLGQLLPTFPRQRFVYGCIIEGQPVAHMETDPNGRYSVENLPLDVYPPYPSGPFRLFSWDVVRFLAYPLLPPRLMTTEDAMLGLRLIGSNITMTKSNLVHPWGVTECMEADRILAVHLAYTDSDHHLYETANHQCASRIQQRQTICSWLPSIPSCQF